MFSLAKKLSLTVRGVMASAIDNLFTALKGRATYSENIADSKQVVKDIDNYELLDKASILLTPTAYSDARVHSVKTYTGDELVTNGNFSDGLNGWNNSATLPVDNLSVVNNKLELENISGSLQVFTSDSFNVTSGETYKISLDTIKESGVDDFDITLRATALGTVVETITTTQQTGSLTYYFTSSSTQSILFQFTLRDTIKGSIDNVSVIDVSSDFDFDRASSATRINSSANIEDITSDLARINYDSNGENGHWLLEPTSTNLVTYSEDFSQWSSSGSATIESGFVSPDGSNSAYKVSGTVGSSSIYYQGVNATDTRTIWARTVSGTGTMNLCSYGQNTNNNFTITEDWQRFEVNGTTTSTGGTNFYALDFRFESANALSEVIIWGAQSEALSYATSYIPTYGSTVTRAAETLTGSGNSTLINSTEGVLYAEIAALVDDNSAREITLSDGTADNRIELRYGAASNRIQLVARSGGVVQASLTNSTNNILNFNKVAVKWKANDFALWINGIEQGADTSGSTPIGLNELQFNQGDGAGGEFLGKVKALAVFDRALTDQELTDLTS